MQRSRSHKKITDEEIEESRRLLEETAPKAKTSESSFMEPPRNRKDGETARQIVFSVREESATTKLVFIGSSPRATHSTVA